MSRIFALASLAALVAGCAGAGSSHPNPTIHLDGGVPADGAHPLCKQPQVSCNGTCANLQTDSANCGACGKVCGNGQSCKNGACSDGCVGNQVLCNNACTDLTSDAGNCGACGHACANGDVCQASACVSANTCQGNLVQCNGQCVDVNSDNANCGGCNQACANGQMCQGGGCATVMNCGNGLTMCNNMCVDTTSDASNCGGCNQPCAVMQLCTNGLCVDGGGNMTGCSGLINCLNNCFDQMCGMMCVDNTTPQGQQLAQALFACLESACPSTQGGVCDPNGNANACDACYTKAQDVNGACRKKLVACDNDLP